MITTSNHVKMSFIVTNAENKTIANTTRYGSMPYNDVLGTKESLCFSYKGWSITETKESFYSCKLMESFRTFDYGTEVDSIVIDKVNNLIRFEPEAIFVYKTLLSNCSYPIALSDARVETTYEKSFGDGTTMSSIHELSPIHHVKMVTFGFSGRKIAPRKS